MKDLQKELEEAKADVARWMEKVKKASYPREMMEYARELTEAKIHLDALKKMEYVMEITEAQIHLEARKTTVDDVLQRALKRVKSEVENWMYSVRMSISAAGMILALDKLTETQMYLEALEWMLEEDEEEV